MLVDTDVLIWHLRGHARAADRLDELGSILLSAVTYMEILQGLRNKSELAAIRKMLTLRAATILPITEDISNLATDLLEKLSLGHGLQMGDALIAATALVHRQPVLTGNVRHFRAIEGLVVEAFLP